MVKKQKRNKQKSFLLVKDKKHKTLIAIVISLFLTASVVYGADKIAETLTKQSETLSGSGRITTTNEVGKETEYVNAGNNSSIIRNYLQGYYYDKVYGYFRLDWSSDKTKNVRIIGTTDKCSSGYGYKLGGTAKSSNGTGPFDFAGYIDFNYNSTTFVYYCQSDGELHGKAYSPLTGYQDFEGIGFVIVTQGDTVTSTGSSNIFTNETTEIGNNEVFTGSTSNTSIDTILGEKFRFDTSQESIFYIVK